MFGIAIILINVSTVFNVPSGPISITDMSQTTWAEIRSNGTPIYKYRIDGEINNLPSGHTVESSFHDF
jgi:hypothetical protein